MKLDAPKNPNYAATIVKLPALLALEGADNLVGVPLYGFQAIVDKSHSVGEIGVVFPPEVQLDETFCKENNLFRHQEQNKDPDAKGYLEDNRRVRAIKLRGPRSDCLFLALESLAYTGANLGELAEGDTFDVLNGKEICQKYVIKTKGSGRQQQKQEKKFVRVDPRLFPEHFDSENYFRNSHLIPQDAWVYVTQKIHGTSWRGTRSLVLRKLSWRDRIAKRLGVKVLEQEWDAVAGSRKVIKDPNNPDQNHFYESDIWTHYLERVENLIPEGFIVYGEIIGYTPEGAAIQTNYTYDLLPKTCELYVYRVAVVNVRGVTVDLSWPQVRQFCLERDLKHVPDLWEGRHADLDAKDWLDCRFSDAGHENALSLGPNQKLVDEGICIRVDGLMPTILKAKSPIFLGHETKLLDKGEVNLEDEGSVQENAA